MEQDAYNNNIVRTTIEAMAAVMGGTQYFTQIVLMRLWHCQQIFLQELQEIPS